MLASARCTVSEKQCHHEILATEKNIQWRKIMIKNTSDEFLFKIFYHSMHCHFHTSFMIFWKLEIRKTSFHLFCQHSTSNLQMWRQTFVCQKFWGDFTFTISSFFFKKCLKISISRSRPISRKFHFSIFLTNPLHVTQQWNSSSSIHQSQSKTCLSSDGNCTCFILLILS